MKQFAILLAVVLTVILFVYMLSRLSSDALGMAVGVVFGVLAGIPSALLVLASSRKQADDEDDDAMYSRSRQGERALPPYPYQPPVIVLAAPMEDKAASSVPTIYDRQRQVAEQRGGRVFRVVGEREEWDE